MDLQLACPAQHKDKGDEDAQRDMVQSAQTGCACEATPTGCSARSCCGTPGAACLTRSTPGWTPTGQATQPTAAAQRVGEGESKRGEWKPTTQAENGPAPCAKPGAQSAPSAAFATAAEKLDGRVALAVSTGAHECCTWRKPTHVGVAGPLCAIGGCSTSP